MMTDEGKSAAAVALRPHGREGESSGLVRAQTQGNRQKSGSFAVEGAQLELETEL
jgi:hypothetical protein